jgi:hypothetical protein
MSYMLRDRPDGQVEIVLNNPILVGIFPERDTAQRVCAFLQADEPDLPVDEPANFAQAAADVRAVVEEVIAESAPEVPKFVRRHTKAFLPALIEEPKTPTVRKTATPPQNLTPDQVEAAFKRIGDGEKIAEVAIDFGIGMGQLRGLWANSKRQAQKHLAEGGQIACVTCTKMFTPSISSPDKCARCSHD